MIHMCSDFLAFVVSEGLFQNDSFNISLSISKENGSRMLGSWEKCCLVAWKTLCVELDYWFLPFPSFPAFV